MPGEVARLEVNLPPLTISDSVGSSTPARASPEPITPHLKKSPSNAERVHSKEQLWQEDRQNRKKRLRKEKQAAKTVKKNSEAVQKQAAPAASSAMAKLRKEERRNTRPDAVLIRPTTGKSYADLLKDIRSKIKPEDLGAEVRAIRPTRTGGLLVELGSKTTDKDGFSLSTAEEVQEAVERELDASAGVVKVFLTQPNRREQKLAVVSLFEREVNQLLRTAKIKVGWVNCRIRRRVEVTRCFRCFGYGHLQTDCKGPDRKALNLCLKCGESGHKRDTCAAKAKCFLCANEDQDTVDTKHTPGSRTPYSGKQIDLLILSEHYRDRVGPNWFPDYLGTTAIWVPNTNVLVKGHGRSRGIVWVNASDAIFVSCYFSPNVNIADFRNQLDDLEDIILTLGNSWIILPGDFNAKSVEWDMPATDIKCFWILEMAARTGLVASNVGSAPTFRRPGYRQTIPVVTFSSERLAGRITDWRVIEDYTGSDHQYNTFSLIGSRLSRIVPTRASGWNASRLSAESLSLAIDEGKETVLSLAGSTTDIVDANMSLIARGCGAAMPRKRSLGRNRRSAYWWTEDIANRRRVCLRLRRKVTRGRRRGGLVPEALMQEYRDARRGLRQAITVSKASRWKELKDDLNADPRGLGYQIVMPRLGAQYASPKMSAAELEVIVNALFPSHQIRPRGAHRSSSRKGTSVQ
ncbi:uncharacterized protein LOC124370722 [Homalodisca vitripennis]|uniref:uncharacterized protein LOC124370722 n=1 Tax=Homalodisca vitripennis TaxID=197043 RepID=UPI001EEBAC31|nr:uncharacterized protein LOC124370722 [Homalodisca vitripennis]